MGSYVYRERLKSVAVMLRTVVDPKRFNLIGWETWSGCTRCAVGHAVVNHLVAGLRLEDGILAYQEHRNWAAVEVAFGLDCADARFLFCSSQYPTYADPLAVADRIQKFLAIKRWPEEVEDAGEERFMAECRAVAAEPIVALEEVAT